MLYIITGDCASHRQETLQNRGKSMDPGGAGTSSLVPLPTQCCWASSPCWAPAQSRWAFLPVSCDPALGHALWGSRSLPDQLCRGGTDPAACRAPWGSGALGLLHLSSVSPRCERTWKGWGRSSSCCCSMAPKTDLLRVWRGGF